MESVLENISNNHQNLVIFQIGANDGQSNDPIANLLRKNKWTGILVEPLPHTFSVLKVNTSDLTDRFKLYNCAIDRVVGKRIIYEIEYQDWMPHFFKELASFSKTFSKNMLLEKKLISPENAKKLDECIVETEIDTETIDTVLEKSNLNKVDGYFIDTEGYDYEIIKLINFEDKKPELIFFEHVHINTADYKKCLKLLKNYGYRLYYQFRDTIAVSEQIQIGETN